ncbi:sodium:solute symporter [Mucilaginibacter rubeus]|uniref:Sodium:solute symporter n=1 Tax=Mucilaginibacter rubeus TaxID=2027860 RepID=A0AAE6JIP9_9SPHI|nr:sodium:solute symporter [Mucilaginibacter rubeus]QEM06073.1 sodium:solute symporter [Mucilaginibacter rubeus]QTE44804.1 sodium:solute symporter [Mucilaginibacter rubeus]QTE51402.1 sodium:solute symporter [Mucilaginibacter rubeus]QTE56489.1 sodium:solute symporter [Mucilaginibacter rubeus]QTE64050.1 sodium:solute symporter [Mucilaginibacter rubeus]
MSLTDWIVLGLTIFSIVLYGIWKSGNNKNIDQFLMGSRSLPWYHVGLSVMATQASAITFLSAPGQAYSDGMRFVQFYFGLPLAMIVLCITFVPIFHRLKVYTAYEFLEQRFDLKTRALTSFLFLVQRGLSTGITIYAPSIILSTILNINTVYTTLFIGGLVIVYTVYGGSKAVSYTQLLQMSIIFTGMFLAGVLVVYLLPGNVSFMSSLKMAGKMGRMNVIDWKFDPNNRYTVWSGLIGGFFLQLSYFGTDQSQVGRYLTGSSVGQSRLGLIMNGLIKIPMQFLILLIGVLVFAFYQFNRPPMFFNQYEVKQIRKSVYAAEYDHLNQQYTQAFEQKKTKANELIKAINSKNEEGISYAKDQLKVADTKARLIRQNAIELMKKNNPKADDNDTNYVFLSFVTQYLPKGLIGLLIAIIFLASMGSTASALNSLASTSVVDIYKRIVNPNATDKNYLNASRLATVFWGLVCIGMALYASRIGNLLEAVNQLGSYIYGTILGVFIVAFYLKKIKGTAVFIAAVITEAIICILGYFDVIAYLWLNAIGALLLIVIAVLISVAAPSKSPPVGETF